MSKTKELTIKTLKKRIQNLIASDLISPFFWEDFASDIFAIFKEMEVEEKESKIGFNVLKRNDEINMNQTFKSIKTKKTGKTAVEIHNKIVSRTESQKQPELPTDVKTKMK